MRPLECVIVINIFLLLVLTTGCDKATGEAEITANKFIAAVAGHDREQIEAFSSSKLSWQVLTRINDTEPAEVIEINTKTRSQSDSWAVIDCVIETRQKDTVDVNWYTLTLVKNSNWQVYSAEPAGPGGMIKANRKAAVDTKDVEILFAKYLDTLLEPGWNKSVTLLVGSAKSAQQMSQPALGESSIINKVENIAVVPLAYEGKTLVARAEYIVDDRPAQVIVTFYNTSEGWRIAEIRAA